MAGTTMAVQSSRRPNKPGSDRAGATTRCLRGALLWATTWLLAGCGLTLERAPAVGPPGAAHASAPVAMTRYRLPLDDVTSGGNPIERGLPVYPPTLLARCPASVEVRVRVHVDRAGRVAEASSRFADAGVEAHGAAFLHAVRAAALQWRFNPLQVTRWAADAMGNSHVVDQAEQPFTRSYVVRFACRGGHGAVGMDEVDTP